MRRSKFYYQGTNHVQPRDQVNDQDWVYTVTVTNNTGDLFDEVVIFYNRVGLSGVVFLEQTGFAPGDVIVFNLDVCSSMQSYVIGFFIGPDLVAKWPSDGVMTPARATTLNPSDVDPCADSWSIG